MHLKPIYTSHGNMLSTDEILKTGNGAKPHLGTLLLFCFLACTYSLAAVPPSFYRRRGRLLLFLFLFSFNGYYAVDVGSSRKCAMHGKELGVF